MTEDDSFDSAAEGRRPYADFEWYACDQSGNIAFLTSAGFAAIPLSVFRSRTEYFTARDFFHRLGLRGGHELHNPGVRMPVAQDWVQMAQRGLFGYDWDHPAGQYEPGLPYRLVASPEHLITVWDVPSPVRQWLETVHFEGVDFSKAAELFVEQAFAQINL